MLKQPLPTMQLPESPKEHITRQFSLQDTYMAGEIYLAPFSQRKKVLLAKRGISNRSSVNRSVIFVNILYKSIPLVDFLFSILKLHFCYVLYLFSESSTTAASAPFLYICLALRNFRTMLPLLLLCPPDIIFLCLIVQTLSNTFTITDVGIFFKTKS